jgi:uncharacterized protein
LKPAHVLGTVAAIFRYPVKSMLGEDLDAAAIDEDGLIGDRAYALIDDTDGKIVSAKNPRKWPRLFQFSAAFDGVPRSGEPLPPVRIMLPDGSHMLTTQPDVEHVLSQALGHEVVLRAREHAPQAPRGEEYWADLEGFRERDAVTDFSLRAGTFFDAGIIHVLTTSTLTRLGAFYPQGQFDPRRFRPNIVLRSSDDSAGFIERELLERTLAIGDQVRLHITKRCSRCVMTTLPQRELPNDTGILRAVAQHNEAVVGVYATVVHGGMIRSGDTVALE